MDSRGGGAPTGADNPVFECIAASERRELLGVLLDRDSPVAERDLAAHLAATERGPSASAGTASGVEVVETALAHTHLPALENVDLIAWDRDDGTVDAGTNPALDDPRFRLLVEAEADGLDEALANLAVERRRVLLTALRDEESALSLPVLSRAILGRETGETDPDPGAVEEVHASLYHVHLPALAAADLVEYDPGADRVAYADHPGLEAVFSVVYEPDGRLVDAYEEFFDGLETAYGRLGREPTDDDDWLHCWRDPHHG